MNFGHQLGLSAHEQPFHPNRYQKGPSHTASPLARGFSHTPLLQKKKGREEREKEAEAAEQNSSVVEDPFDFSILEAGIEKSLDRLKNDLSKLRTGGRFNPEMLENLRVQLSKDSKATERLGDLAQVLPKGGRSLMVLVGENDVSCDVWWGACLHCTDSLVAC